MKNKLIIILAIWLTGFVAAMSLVARWWRMGDQEMDAAPPSPIVEEAPPASMGTKVQQATQRITSPLVTGAKQDLVAMRKLGNQIRNRLPSTSSELQTDDAA